MKKSTLDFVNKQYDGINEIRANIRYFNREATASCNNSSRAHNLLSTTRYWLYDEATDAFGPSKFVGFKSMTFQRYNCWLTKTNKTSPGKFLGGATRIANEKTLGTNFAPNPSLAKKLVEWGEKLFVAGIFKGTCQDKWRFIKIPNSRPY